MINKVKIARLLAGMTQEDLAKEIGVTRQAIHSIEHNKYVPSTVLALKIARCLEKNVEELFELEDGD